MTRELLRSLALLWLFGICLRITVLAIPPVMPLIHGSFSLSQAAVGALTSLPVLLFSLAAIPGSLLVSRLGAAHVLTAGILITAIGGALRGGALDAPQLFAATFAMGLGIAIMQPALPALVRDWTPQRIALGTATYSNALLVGESISASLTIPVLLPLLDGSWRASLVAWSVPVLAIGLLSAWVSRKPSAARPASPRSRQWWPDWHDPLTWKLGLVCGFASSLYFATNAFMPDYLAWRGRPDLLASTLSVLNWVQIPASIVMLAFADKLTLKRWPFVALTLLSGLALLGLLLSADAAILWWAGVIGFGNAFLLILTLALPPLLGRPEDVHRLSAAMIAIGYLCAFLLPIAGGLAWDATGKPVAAFAPILLLAALALVLSTQLDFRSPAKS